MDTETNQENNDDLFAPYGVDEHGEAFKPNPTQKRVLNWVDNVRAGKYKKTGIPVLVLMGGVGSGKTRGMMAPVCEMLFEIPGLRVLWGRQDLKDLKLSVIDKMDEEIIPRSYVLRKSEQYNWRDIQVTDNPEKSSRIYYNGLKDLTGFGSQEFGVVVITEAHETIENAYRTLKRRLRQVGVPVMMLIESEPPNEDHWLVRLTDPSGDDYDPDIEMWNLSTYENWDNLPESYKQSLETMPKSWQKKYLFGQPGFIPDGRPFYEGFSQQIHTGNFTYNNRKIVARSWDFGFHHPAVSFHQIDDMGRWYVLRELMGKEITIDKFCDQVTEFCNSFFPDHHKWEDFGDPACMQHNDKSEKTSWDICKDKGFKITVHQSTYRLRKELIDGKLSKMTNGKPCLRVDNSCKVLIDGLLGGYHYPERKPGAKNTAAFEIPYEDGYYEHLCNTIEYYAIHKFKPLVNREKNRKKYKYRTQREDNAGYGY